MSYDIYTGLLKAFSLPTAEKTAINFLYDNENSQFTQLKSAYPIETIAGDGGDFSKAVNLLNWVSEHTYHKGDFDGAIGFNSLALLDYAYDKGALCGINCGFGNHFNRVSSCYWLKSKKSISYALFAI